MRVLLCGGVAIETGGRRLPDTLFAGRQGRLTFAYLVCERHRSVPREELAELLWGDRLPASWASSVSAVISKLRRLLTEAGLDGPAALPSAFGSYRLHLPDETWIDWEAIDAAVEIAEAALVDGEPAEAIAHAKQAQEIARRGFLNDDSLWVDTQRERLRELHVRAAHVQAEAHMRAGDHGHAVEAARHALSLDEMREGSFRLLMNALAAAGERGEALRVWERCRTLLVDELGTDPAPETEAVYLSILGQSASSSLPTLPSGVVTFLLTDIVDSTKLWERHPSAMAIALERHDELVTSTVESHSGVLLKAKLEGDATVSVFRRASAGALAALALQDALAAEPWPEGAAPAVRMALHTGEAIERDGDYFGPALNRAARLRSLAGGGQILVSQAVAEVIRDHLPDDAGLHSIGERQLRGLSRNEHVFELGRGGVVDDTRDSTPEIRLPLPAVLASHEPFVGREDELGLLATDWATATAGTARAVLIGGEPGVGKTRLAAEWARRVHDEDALVLYGRCDEELGAPYQPFAEALRVLVPQLSAERLRAVRGIEEVSRLVPELHDALPGLASPTQADPDNERYLLFDALVRLLASISRETPVLVVVDDLHWAAKPTLLLLRHLLRSGEGLRLQIVGTYRSTDLDRAHPLADALVDLHRDGTADRIALDGLGAGEVNAYLSAAGYNDARLGAALATVTSGNPFFLIEALRHVEESGGTWDASTLPQGVREAVGRRLSRLSVEANEALLAGAVAGSQFSLDLIERVLERDLVAAVEEARNAGLVVEERGASFRFNHALVRQTLLTEVASVRRVRLHQRIAAALEADGPDANDANLADLARHYFESAFAGGAAKAVDYSRRAGEQAMARLAYEEAAELYDRALQAADIDGSECDDHDKAELLLARCEALLAAGDPTSAAGVVEQLERVARGSARLSAWATCYRGQLAALIHPEDLAATAQQVASAAREFAALADAEGEAKAHTVQASCLARLGRVAECEAALDQALTAGRRADNPRRVNAVLAGAPLAALWGPSPVARASGRCLDVVRVLRITTGSAAVETVALRSQAVLEALRGRIDAARRMLASTHRSLEAIGHTWGMFETDVFAGIVELLAGEPADAETALRRAYDGFVSRGVGVDAAQAAALLARAVLAQGRVEEAIALTEDSEQLAGVDLKAAIAWRAARAEALAQQGRQAEALDAARAAVALADPTDALIDQADAHLSLALVLRAGGEDTDAEREARRAIELYERKGATARVEAVRELVQPAATQSPAPAAAALPHAGRRVRSNHATRSLARDYEAIAALGERHALVRHPAATAQTGILAVVRVDDAGAETLVENFGPDELPQAIARLVELHAEDELPPELLEGRRRLVAMVRNDSPFRWAEDAVVVDHRSASLGTLTGRDDIRAAGRALRDLAPNVRRRITDVLALTENVFLVATMSTGDAEHGSAFELATVALGVFDEQGQQRRAEWFDPDQIDEAFARFDQFVTGPIDYLSNDAARKSQLIADLLLDADFASLVTMIDQQCVLEDRRPMFTLRVEGRDAFLAFADSIRRAGVTEVTTVPLATRGDRLALYRQTHRGPDGEVVVLSVNELSSDGVFVRCVLFDSEDMTSAYDELHARFEAIEGVPDDDPWRASMAVVNAYNTRDWDALREICADGFRCIDHRRLGTGERNWDEYVAFSQSMIELAPDTRLHIAAMIRADESHGLCALHQWGHDLNGSAFEIVRLATGVFEDHKLLTLEFLADDDVGTAIERFESLSSVPVQRLSNDAVVSTHRMAAALPAGDITSLTALIDEDVVAEDRRHLMHLRANGRDEFLAYLGSIAMAGVTNVSTVVLATRGNTLTLVRQTVSGTSGETIVLAVNEVSHDGRFTAGVLFDENDIDAAYDELEARYIAGEAAGNEVAEMAALYVKALNERDWERFRALHADDFTSIDHRPVAMGEVDRTAFVSMAQVLPGSVPDMKLRTTEVLGLTEDGIATASVSIGTDQYGGPVEWAFLTVAIWEKRRAQHFELFPVDDRAAVLSRLEELRAERPDLLANAATRADRSRTPIATRGEWLALTRVCETGATGTTTHLSVDEYVPAEDRLDSTPFDVNDLDAAFDELDARYAAGEASAWADQWNTAVEYVRAFNRRDFDRLRALHADGAQFVDHQTLGFDAADLETYLAFVDQFVIDAPDSRWRTLSILHRTEHRLATVFGASGTTTFDAAVEWEIISVGCWDGERITRLELFPATERAAAIARLEELSSFMPRTSPEVPLNKAARHWGQFVERFIARDWAGLAALLCEELEAYDHRAIVGGRKDQGRDAAVTAWQSVAAVGVTAIDSVLVATRGERLVLLRCLLRGSTGEAEMLFVNEIDEQGRYLGADAFDPGDLDAAFAALDRRYANGEAAGCADAWRIVSEFIDASNKRDWDAMATLAADDYEVIDHRPAGLGPIEGDAFQDYVRTMADIVPDSSARCVAVLRLAPNCIVTTILVSGESTDGAQVELPYLSVTALRDGLAYRTEVFPLAEADTAFALFDSFSTQ